MNQKQEDAFAQINNSYGIDKYSEKMGYVYFTLDDGDEGVIFSDGHVNYPDAANKEKKNER